MASEDSKIFILILFIVIMEAQTLEELGSLLISIADSQENMTPIDWNYLNEELLIVFAALSDDDSDGIGYNVQRIKSYLTIE